MGAPTETDAIFFLPLGAYEAGTVLVHALLTCDQMLSAYKPKEMILIAGVSRKVFAAVLPHIRSRLYAVTDRNGVLPEGVGRYYAPLRVATHEKFKGPMVSGMFAERITRLVVDSRFDGPLVHLPQRLTHLDLGERFDRAIDNLPAGLTHLWIGDSFNQSLDNLPAGLTHLDLGEGASASTRMLPTSLKYLARRVYNMRNPYPNTTLAEDLPCGLEQVIVRGDFFFSPSAPVAPITTLKYLHARYARSNEEWHVHARLTRLSIIDVRKEELRDLPPTLRRLSVNELTAESIAGLPRELTHLALTHETFDAPVDNLPSALTHLVIKSQIFNQRVDRLPLGLEYLRVDSERFDSSIEALPPALKILRLYRRCVVLARRPEIRVNEPGDWIHDLTGITRTRGEIWNEPQEGTPSHKRKASALARI